MNWGDDEIDVDRLAEIVSLTICIGALWSAFTVVVIAQDIGSSVCAAPTALDMHCKATVVSTTKLHATIYGVVGVAAGAVWVEEPWNWRSDT